MSTTRRDLLHGALAGGAAALGLGISSKAAAADPTALLAGATSDGQLLSRLLGFEQLEVFTYGRVEHVLGLPPRERAAVARFLGQEHRHAQLLAAAVARHGARAPAPPADVAAANRELSALGVDGRLDRIVGSSAAIHLLISVETAAETVYYRAVERLSSPTLVTLGAEIMGCEAQHWTGLSALLHHGNPSVAVPRAFAPFVGQFSA